MEIFLQQWRNEIGIGLAALFVWMAVWSRRTVKRHSEDRNNFYHISGFSSCPERIQEAEKRLSRLLPYWEGIETLTLHTGRSVEVIECRFTEISGNEVCMVRFVDRASSRSGTTTDTESPRTIFLSRRERPIPAIAAFLEFDFQTPALLKMMAGMCDSVASLVNQGELTMGLFDPLKLNEVTSQTVTSAFAGKVYTERETALSVDQAAILSRIACIKDTGIFRFYCREGDLALESIYGTPANAQGAKCLVNSLVVWRGLERLFDGVL